MDLLLESLTFRNIKNYISLRGGAGLPDPHIVIPSSRTLRSVSAPPSTEKTRISTHQKNTWLLTFVIISYNTTPKKASSGKDNCDYLFNVRLNEARRQSFLIDFYYVVSLANGIEMYLRDHSPETDWSRVLISSSLVSYVKGQIKILWVQKWLTKYLIYVDQATPDPGTLLTARWIVFCSCSLSEVCILWNMT